jgi:integrase
MERQGRSITWYEHACDFISVKWPQSSARHRKGLAEALTTVTVALLTRDVGAPSVDELRTTLFRWSFNALARQSEPPIEYDEALRWIEDNSPPLASLRDAVQLRNALNAISVMRDGRAASASTVTRKRSALYSALQHAVELEYFEANPLDRIKWKAPASGDVVDRRVVVNPQQARMLLHAVHGISPAVEAFFGCLYFAALRPSEARNLRVSDCQLPEAGWGELILTGSHQASGRAWTDSGRADEERQLKHRGVKDTRHVPIHPELVSMLRRHLDEFGTGVDGRLFVTRTGKRGVPLAPPYCNPLSMGTAYRVWHKARAAALTPKQVASPLARRPYDLRHACVSTWLNAGVPATQVAEWAGHSVNVLLRVYAKCLDGQDDAAKRRIEEVLG